MIKINDLVSFIIFPIHLGIFGVIKGLFSGNEEGSRAAGVQQGFNDQAIRELRRQFNLTSKKFKPFVDAGTNALSDLVQGSTLDGLNDRLAGIFNTDTFSSLHDFRRQGTEGALAAGGLMRSGKAIESLSQLPIDVALALEGMLTGRTRDLVGIGQNSVAGEASLGSNLSNNIAGILTSSGRTAASGILTDAQSKAQGQQNLLNLAGSVAGLFSDPNLKENVKELGDIDGLKFYEWDWIPGAKGSLIEDCPRVGFMADEVKEKHPDLVREYCGLMTVDYPELINRLEAA